MKKQAKEFSQIIKAFRRQFGWTICIHDYSGKTEGLSEFKDHYHSFATCAYAKKHGCLQQCISFDSEIIQTRLFQASTPFFKLCHAGIIECVVPLKQAGIVTGTMFVGQFRWASKQAVGDFIKPPLMAGKFRVNLTGELRKKLIPIGPDSMPDIIEISKTIASRLETALKNSTKEKVETQDIKWRIEGFLTENFLKETSLSDLAKHIWLSESRTSHILKEHFGKTFPELINHYKLERAKELLEYTSLSVREIACLSGFNDPGYFHRIFSRVEGMTAGNYRASCEERDNQEKRR